jgi:hypothetical protein
MRQVSLPQPPTTTAKTRLNFNDCEFGNEIRNTGLGGETA